MGRLSMDDKVVKKDLTSLEKYRNRKIDFYQLKAELEKHNGIKIFDYELENLLRKSGFDR